MIKVELVGTDKVIARFASLPQKARQSLIDAMKRQWFALQAHVVSQKLSGQVLKRVTGNLASSINVDSKFEESPAEIVGSVGTKVIYGAIHEDGGTVNVKAHTRNVTQVFGRPITPVEAFVRAHTATYPQRSFLRSSINDLSGQIRSDIEQSVRTALGAA
jgi:phage gpG-like protein